MLLVSAMLLRLIVDAAFSSSICLCAFLCCRGGNIGGGHLCAAVIVTACRIHKDHNPCQVLAWRPIRPRERRRPGPIRRVPSTQNRVRHWQEDDGDMGLVDSLLCGPQQEEEL